jgi:hypothetical protein
MGKRVIEVKDGAHGFRVLRTISVTPRQHAGWQSVGHQHKRYQVCGGIRNAEFIDISNPIKGRQ